MTWEWVVPNMLWRRGCQTCFREATTEVRVPFWRESWVVGSENVDGCLVGSLWHLPSWGPRVQGICCGGEGGWHTTLTTSSFSSGEPDRRWVHDECVPWLSSRVKLHSTPESCSSLLSSYTHPPTSLSLSPARGPESRTLRHCPNVWTDGRNTGLAPNPFSCKHTGAIMQTLG